MKFSSKYISLFNNMKKIIKPIVICIIVFLMGRNVPFNYNSDRSVDYLVNNANSKSKCMCAWYVMKALHAGGCFPCGIYPAYAYKDNLINMGFSEINSNEIKKGDVCVLSQNSKSEFGHIAIYDGNYWISDFKQKSIYPNQVYKDESSVHFYRLTNGWHRANIWISPSSIIEYIKVLVNNYKKIKI